MAPSTCPGSSTQAYTEKVYFYHLDGGQLSAGQNCGTDMQNPFRHMFDKGTDMAQPAALQRWAEAQGHAFRKVHDASGCVIEGASGPQAWRIEWGASKRSYIEGCEIRLMADLGLSHSLMAMVLNRVLMAAMEKEVYEQYVNDVQTRIDTDTPPEMRWLVMYAKLDAAGLGTLKDRFGAVSSAAPWLTQWLSADLRNALIATVGEVRSDQPFALVVARGRLTLRTAMPAPDAGKLALWFAVFEQALLAARQVAEEWQHAAQSGQTTHPVWDQGETAPEAASGRAP